MKRPASPVTVPASVAPAFAVVLGLVATFPAWWRPELVTAWADGEADNHLWMHWQAVHAGVWSNIPDGPRVPLMDPVNTPWFALGFLADPAVAWNVAWLGSVALALAGGWALGRAAAGPLASAGSRPGARDAASAPSRAPVASDASGGPTAAGAPGASDASASAAPAASRTSAGGVDERVAAGLVGLAALGTSPFLHGMGAFGLTEDWTLGWLALAVAALIADVPVAAAACLGAYALSGGYAMLFAAVLAPFVVKDRRSVAAVAGAALVALPLAVTIVRAGAWGDRVPASEAVPPSFDPGWATRPSGGADLLALFLPSVDAVPSGRSTYLGIVLLGLAIAGVLREPRVRRPAAGAAVLLTLALGVRLRIAGYLTPLPLPAAVLAMLPGLSSVHHWYRAVGPATVLLVPAVVAGARGNPRWAVAVALDALLMSANPLPREQYDPRPPSAIADVLRGEGGLVLLPFDNGRAPFEATTPRLYDRWGPWIGRPLSEDYDGPDALLLSNRLIATADRACGLPAHVPPDWQPSAAFADVSRLEPDVVRGSVVQLERAGVTSVALLTDRAPSTFAGSGHRDRRGPDCRAVLVDALGPPTAERDGVVRWDLR